MREVHGTGVEPVATALVPDHGNALVGEVFNTRSSGDGLRVADEGHDPLTLDHLLDEVHVAAHVFDPATFGNASGNGVAGQHTGGLADGREEDESIVTPQMEIGQITKVASTRPPVSLARDEQRVEILLRHGHANALETSVSLGKRCMGTHC